MYRLPWMARKALDNRAALGPASVPIYWEKHMTPRQRNDADVWLMRHRPSLVARCGRGSQRWRFIALIEELYEDWHRMEVGNDEDLLI